ncbi:MAG: hypothetical protein R3F13_08600 [Prosthecobacter sp.]
MAHRWTRPILDRTPHGAAFAEIVRYLRSASIPIRVIGRGSNLLVKDGGIRGAVIHPKGDFENVTVNGNEISAGAGARLKKSPARRATLASAASNGWKASSATSAARYG